MINIPLSDLKIGQTAKVVEFLEDNQISQRIEEMGLTIGEEIEILRFAPLGDPIEIKIRGYLLSLRKEEAESILVSL